MLTVRRQTSAFMVTFRLILTVHSHTTREEEEKEKI